MQQQDPPAWPVPQPSPELNNWPGYSDNFEFSFRLDIPPTVEPTDGSRRNMLIISGIILSVIGAIVASMYFF